MSDVGVPASGRPVPPATAPDEEARALLTAGEIEVLGRFRWASNATLLAQVRLGGDEGLAVYKPGLGERPLWDFPPGLYRREVAAHLVSAWLRWDLVPLTVVREGPFGTGSLQRFVEFDQQVTAFDLLERGHPSMPLIAAFDVVVNNADRKAGHCLLVPSAAGEGHVWAIDHGLCFHALRKLRTVIWDFAGEAVAEPIAADLLALAEAVGSGPLCHQLSKLLTAAELRGLAARARDLAGSATYPHPSGERPYPWPLV